MFRLNQSGFKTLLFICALISGLTSVSNASTSINKPGPSFHGIMDFREVMPGVLYRGGASKRTQLNADQLQALCEYGIGSAIYLYNTGFSGHTSVDCAKGSMNYDFITYLDAGLTSIHKRIYDAIKSNDKPIFIHCWYGIHATGLVAATALMQFCGMSADQAVAYWKIGIVPKLQYPNLITTIQNFHPNPTLALTPAEQSKVCP